jgi:cbb3-type cytochrome oxidase subunit 3
MLKWVLAVFCAFIVVAIVAIAVGKPLAFFLLFVAFVAYSYFVYWAGKRKGVEITAAAHAWKDEHISALEARVKQLGGDVVTGLKKLVHRA